MISIMMQVQSRLGGEKEQRFFLLFLLIRGARSTCAIFIIEIDQKKTRGNKADNLSKEHVRFCSHIYTQDVCYNTCSTFV